MSVPLDPTWLRRETESFALERHTYEALADKVKAVLVQACARYAPLAKPEARAKTMQSFAEKAIRKREKYQRPSRELTDLAGGRIVTYTDAEVDAICRWLEREEGLTIDWANSLQTRQRLRTGEFGYIASHYVVQLSGPMILGVDIPRGLRQLKCEIQITTFLRHVWAAIDHDRLYKSNLHVPEQIKRKTAEVAALLEVADTAFAETAASLDQYLVNFATSLSPERLAEDIERWKAVLAADPEGPDREATLLRIGQLQLAACRPREAHATLKALEDSQRPDLQRELGRAAHLAGRKAKARRYLGSAIGLDAGDWLAHKYLADVDLVDDPGKALVEYGEAHRLAPVEPRVLGPLLECELRINGDARVLHMMRGSLQAGIDECRRRIDLQVHVPQAYLEEGRLALYQEPKEPFAALAAYSRAVADRRNCVMLADELEAIERIVAVLEKGPDIHKLEECEDLQGFVWVRDFLRVALVATARRVLRDKADPRSRHERLTRTAREWDDDRRLDGIGTIDGSERPRFGRPVLIVAGGCAPEAEQDIVSCQSMLEKALAGFAGTVIGGGTRAGVSGLTAELLGRQSDVQLLGYLPRAKPKSDRLHRAYKIVWTRGCGYGALGPLQTWADLLRAGIEPKEVRVLGINGGQLAGFEYRLALALGAVVGVVQGSGRAAERLLPDPFWQSARGFAPLPRDWASIAAFVNLERQAEAPLTAEVIDELAGRVHESFRRPGLEEPGRLPDNLLPWAKLPKSLQDSNRDQMRYAVFILRRAGLDAVPGGGGRGSRPPVPDAFEEQLELMAEMEHGRYVAERLSTGWRRGDQNSPEKRTNPTLVPWGALGEGVKEKDRRTVRTWPDRLWEAGLMIVARKQPKPGRRGGKKAAGR